MIAKLFSLAFISTFAASAPLSVPTVLGCSPGHIQVKKYLKYQKYFLTLLSPFSSGEMSPPSTGSAQSEASKYPPTEFSLKYAKVLAPNGKLVSPDQVFGEGGIFDKDVEEKTKLAFKVTMKKELFQYEISTFS